MGMRRGISHSGDRANSFEDRVVAFIDIIGFRTVVEDARTDGETFKTVRDALNTINEQVQRFEKYRQWRESLNLTARAVLSVGNPVEMTAFSDCYLISGRISAKAHLTNDATR